MRHIIEGTEEQFKRLHELMRGGDLPEIKKNYAIESPWCAEDVTNRYECDEDTALEIMNDVLVGDVLSEIIHERIDYEARDRGLKEIL
jgi:hypothetical protein